MTPTLNGRIQSRLVLVLLIGGIWTFLITPILPGKGGASLGDAYTITFQAIAIVALFGVVWELVYHALQQFRWEKDWPTLFGLLTGINEFFTTWILLEVFTIGGLRVPAWAFFFHFLTTWFVVWLAASSVIRVLFPRWRFNGGRFI